MDHVFDIFNQYATDPNKELDGVWVSIGPALRKDADGKPDPSSAPQIKVARSGNKRHGRIVSQLWEANEDVLKGKDKDLADARGEEVTIEAMSKAILLGWKNLTFKGVKLPDTWDIETAQKLLAVKDFRDLVAKHANEREKYLMVQEQADSGN